MRLPIALIAVGTALGQQPRKYDGPRPPKPDLVYLLHARNLVPAEEGEAKEEDRKEETANIVAGAASPARTPLAEPIFLFNSEKIPAEKLELYRMTVKSGQREVAVPKNAKKAKNRPRPLRLLYTRLDGSLYRIEVNEGMGLEMGEYCLSPQESQKVFCFQVY